MLHSVHVERQITILCPSNIVRLMDPVTFVYTLLFKACCAPSTLPGHPSPILCLDLSAMTEPAMTLIATLRALQVVNT